MQEEAQVDQDLDDGQDRDDDQGRRSGQQSDADQPEGNNGQDEGKHEASDQSFQAVRVIDG